MMGIVQCSVFTMISLMIQQSSCPAVTTEKCHMAVHEQLDIWFTMISYQKYDCPAVVTEKCHMAVHENLVILFTMISLLIQKSGCPAVPSEKCHMAVHEVPWEEKKEVVWNKVTCTKNVSQSRLTLYYVHAMKQHEFLPAERKRKNSSTKILNFGLTVRLLKHHVLQRATAPALPS